MSRPLQMMPMISKANTTLKSLFSGPPAWESLFGMLRAEKSITVCPSCIVEGVELTSRSDDEAGF